MIKRYKTLRAITFSVTSQNELGPWATCVYQHEIWDGDTFLSSEIHHEQERSMDVKKLLAETPVQESD